MIITLLKAIHIAALMVWLAGLLALPLMLARHEEGENQSRYARIRLFTYYGYTLLVTPAAVIAITAGTPLIFLREIFVPWLFVKLAAVALLVVIHVYIGHVVLAMGEKAGKKQPPHPMPILAGLLAVILTILVLVLLKPPLDEGRIPDWLQRPFELHLPLDEVPN